MSHKGKRAVFTVGWSLPVCLNNQTSAVSTATSRKCQKQSLRWAATPVL